MKHVMVTGATGFIGNNLVKRLTKNKIAVTAVVRDITTAETIFSEEKDRVSFYLWNNSVESLVEYMKIHQVDCVVHLATRYITKSSAADINDLVESNIAFGMKILEAMKLAGVRNIVNSSTSWQHYQNEAYNPVNVYAATKQAFEDILKYYTNAEGIRAIILEIYDTYGAFDNRGKLLNYWKQILETQEAMLLSPGEQKLDYVYIEDVLDGMERAMQLLEQLPATAEGYEAKYALSSDEVYSLQEIVEIFESVYEKKIPIIWGGKPYRDREVMEPYRGLERLPGWNAGIGLRKGFEQVKKDEQGA